MSKWAEIKNDYCNDEGYVCIDAWLTNYDNEEGKVIAFVNIKTKEVAYVDNMARMDSYAQRVIEETIKNIENGKYNK